MGRNLKTWATSLLLGVARIDKNKKKHRNQNGNDKILEDQPTTMERADGRGRRTVLSLVLRERIALTRKYGGCSKFEFKEHPN